MEQQKEIIVDYGSSSSPLIKTLTANITYNPESIYYNDNSNNKTVLSASVVGQKMTVINNGVEPTFDWSQVGSPISYPIQIF